MVEWNNGTVEWWNSGTTTPIERALMTTFTQHLVTGLRLGDLHHREYWDPWSVKADAGSNPSVRI